jgi:hypothetical protein
MAGNPSAVVTLAGLVRSVERFDTKPDVRTGDVRQAARVNVLTEPAGGFCEVYVGPDDLAALPAEDGAAVLWLVTVRAGNRSFTRSDGSTAEFANLWVRFVSAAGQGAGARRLEEVKAG